MPGKSTTALFIVAAALSVISCDPSGASDDKTATHPLRLYVSLGAASTLPGTGDYQTLLAYGEKKAIFSVKGVSAGVNDVIDLVYSCGFGLTGATATDYTEYASCTFDLSNPADEYPGGEYRVRMFIDWDASGIMNAGDVVMATYSVVADKDNDPNTAGETVTTAEYGAGLSYSASDYSLVVDDPLTYGSGFGWIVNEIHEGSLAIMP